ncbi:MAG: ABC-F family ATP-binding cassette domain-containing protein, partial [Firmicutes bacterium]|nr:ABC-F family ATP-binding cassette domain-containing protein [Bacillota bacterium]
TRDARIGFLAQQPKDIPSGTLRDHLEYPLRHIFSLREQLRELELQISEHAEKEGRTPEELLNRYADLTARFEEDGGYQVESKLNGVARGLGFTEADFSRDIKGFSGGEKTRARLAGLLLQELDLLLLDEPTNFLDLLALQWLEKYLRDLSCAVIVVSHDRFFLDRSCNLIFALQNHSIKTYSGNYSAYQQKLEQERLSKDREYKQMLLHRAREERLVREAKADERSKRQARSRQKRLEKLETVTRVEDSHSFKLGLGYSGRSGRQVITFDQVSHHFDSKALFNQLSFEICWGDRIALIGPNGAGKTTLLKLISGALKPSHGHIRLGPAVRVLYFSQEQEHLVPHHDLIETIINSSDLNVKEARNLLGRYLFRGDDVFKQVRDLSGGEKSRLALARLSLSTGNCLLMDEPTSHLDLPALEELEKVLLGYPGTLIIVSHDRYFLKGLANRVFELETGQMQIYDLDFEEYLELKESSPTEQKSASGSDRQQEKARRQEEHRRRQTEHRQLRRLKDEQLRLEEEISTTEEEIARLEETLSNPEEYGDHNQLAELGSQLDAARARLDDLLETWENLSHQLEP